MVAAERGAESSNKEVLADAYEITSIGPVAAPVGEVGSGWHRYEISQGINKIVGYRSGGIDKVTLAVESMVLQLNERRKHQRGRVHVILKSRSSEEKPAST